MLLATSAIVTASLASFILGLVMVAVVLVIYAILLPGLLWVAYKNPVTCPVLLHGWTPILMSMVISSGGGVVLHTAVDNFPAIAMFAPVMNGAGGNLVAIQASRMTTYLNKATNSLYGIFPREEDRVCILPCSALCGGLPYCAGKANVQHASIARILLLLLIPGHMLFLGSLPSGGEGGAVCTFRTLLHARRHMS